MDFELRAAKEKLEREQRLRKEQARARSERERKAKEEASKHREALETVQRLRRIEEAEAAAAASQQEENDLFAGDGVRFNSVVRATLSSGVGDKISLPPSAFQHLSAEGALEKGPMFFEITLVSKASAETTFGLEGAIEKRITHAGVLQFTAPEGFAELPLHVWHNAGLAEGMVSSSEASLVRIRYVRLPKGVYAKLQSETADFADVPNHRAVLETKLRQHATLSEGDMLTVQHGGIDYSLRVLELRPASNVSVLETDIEVDVTAGSSAQGRLACLELGKPECGFVDEGDYKYYKFVIDQNLVDAATKGDIDIVIRLEVDGDGTTGDADLYMAMHPILFPTRHRHHLSSHDIGTKIICLTGPGKTLCPSSYSVGVYGFCARASYKISVYAQPSQPAAGQKIGFATVKGQANSNIQEGFEVCENCKQAVPSRTVGLHEAYCRRHNAVCKYPGCGVVLRLEEVDKHVHCFKCGQSLRQEELSKHLKIYHEPQTCSCGVVLEREEMLNHQATMCPLRMITCRFCGDMVQAGQEAEDFRDKLRGLTQHECICGARTAPCDSCGRAIMLKDMDLHRAAAHNPAYEAGKAHAGTMIVPSAHNAMANNVREGDTIATESTGKQVNYLEQHTSVQCPICSLQFEGSTAEGELNMHLDNMHFSSEVNSSIPANHVQGLEETFADSSYRRFLSVSCPICGLAVHSERDLSSHMDMVH